MTVWICLLVACAPSLIDHVARLWQQAQYHYLPALLLAVVLLVWQRWDRVWRLPQNGWSWALLAMGLVFLILAFLAGSSWVGTLGLVFFLGAWFASHCDVDYYRSLIGLWPPCWLLLPLPLGLDASLTTWLQRWSSRLSSFSLDFLVVPHALFGNVLELPSGKLFVEEACSGVQSLYTVIFVAVLLVAYFRRTIWSLPLYILAAIFWAGIMNVVRIVSIAYAADRFGIDLAHGWQHALLGYFCLALAVLFLLSSDRLFRVLLFPIEPNVDRKAETNPLVYRWNKMVWDQSQKRSAAEEDADIGGEAAKPTEIPVDEPSPSVRYACFAIVGLALLIGGGQAWQLYLRGDSSPVVAAGEPFLQVPPDIVDQLDGFTRAGHEVVEAEIDDVFGQHSDIWQGDYRGTAVTLALSQPYPVWHDLCVCYTGIGLKMNERQILDGPDQKDWNYISARLVDDSGEVTYLWFSGIDGQRRPVFAPDSSLLTRWITRIRDGGSLISGEAQASEVAMIQLVVRSDGFLPPDRVVALEQLHLSSRDLFRESGEKNRVENGE